jgi:hypothetical protein
MLLPRVHVKTWASKSFERRSRRWQRPSNSYKVPRV